MKKPQLMIIGAGPAGLSAAVYGCRYGMEVTVFESLSPGGQMNSTPQVDNYPGIMEIDGYSLSEAMRKQAVALGTIIKNEEVTELLLEERQIKTKEALYNPNAIIIATGAKRKKLMVKGEEEFTGKGVSYCATCDAAFYKGKVVAIVGGGNTALEDALFLSRVCSKVYLVHRREEFRGMNSLENAVRNAENVELHLSSEVKEIVGDKKVSSIILKPKKKEEISIEVAGVFIAVGTEPENALYSEKLPSDKSGYIIAGEDCQTMLPGVFVAGDCRKKPLRQIVTAASDGAVAAFSAAIHCSV